MVDTFINTLKESFLSNIGKKKNNFQLIKHYNTFYFSSNDIKTLKNNNLGLSIYFHELDASSIVGPFEPFLDYIRDYCTLHTLDLNELFDSCNVYSLHRCIIESYIKTGRAVRTEDILLDEVSYEQKKIVSSITNILLYITKDRPLLFVINELQSASPSTLHLLNDIYQNPNNQTIGLLATYNESQHTFPASESLWNVFYSFMVEGEHFIESGTMIATSHYERLTDFNFSANEIENYLIQLQNLISFLGYKHAIYYMEIIYKIISIEGVYIPEKKYLEFLEKYTICAIYTEDISQALLLANSIRVLSLFKSDIYARFTYNYLLSLAYTYNGKLDSAEIYANHCITISEQMNQGFLNYKSKMLIAMIKMDGWHDVYLSDQARIEPQLVDQALSFKQYNHLAHMYTYGYETKIEEIKKEEDVEEKLFHANRGIAYARMLGNEHFLFKAYRNSILLATDLGYYHLANRYYQQVLSIVKGNDLFAEANIYNGLGFNSSALEEYTKANEYYNKALRIFYDLDLSESIGETFYNMAQNCIMAHDYTNALKYLGNTMDIIQKLKLNSLKVCTISKIYSLLAFTSCKLQKKYSANVYLNSARQFVNHLFSVSFDGPKTKSENLDDLIIYYYSIALNAYERESYEDSLLNFNKAEEILSYSISTPFFFYADFMIDYSKVLFQLNQTEKANGLLTSVKTYYENRQCTIKASIIQAAMDHLIYHEPDYHLTLENISARQITQSLEHVAIQMENLEHRARMQFLSTWQKILDINGKTKDELIESVIHTFMNYFNLDRLVYVQYEDEQANVLFNNTNIEFSDGLHNAFQEYFKKKRLGFVTSKIKNNYNDYLDIITLFEAKSMCSIVGIPFYTNEKLEGLMFCYILMKNNWHSSTSHYMLDESDFKIFDFVFRQFITALNAYDAHEKIHLMNVKLKHLSNTDHLTGLLNREGFYSNIRQLIAESESPELPISILYIDLDNFKYYNDSFGHNIGDLLLVNMAKLFERVVGNKGFVSRYGGDEFIIFLQSDNREFVTKIAKEIYLELERQSYFKLDIERALNTEIEINAKQQITCSIGIATSNSVFSEESFHSLLKRADSILYDIKKSTKGTYSFL